MTVWQPVVAQWPTFRSLFDEELELDDWVDD